MVSQIRASHYMIFSISAFALFILMSYYASTNNLTNQLHTHITKALHHHHRQKTPSSLGELNSTKNELNGANLGENNFANSFLTYFNYFSYHFRIKFISTALRG